MLHGFVEPRYTAAAPDGRHGYVTDAGRGEVVTVDVRRAEIVERTTVGAHARHLSLDAVSGRLWIALGFSASEIVALDTTNPSRPRVVNRIARPFPAHDVVFAPDGDRVWISSGNKPRLAVYDPRTRKPLFELVAGKPPQHIVCTAARAYVTSDGELRMHVLGNGRVERRTAVPPGSYNITHGSGRVFTPSFERGTLAVLDERGRLLAQHTVAKAAHDACSVLTT